MINLLEERIFTIDDVEGRKRYFGSLTTVLAALTRGENISLGAMRAHQSPAVFSFLCQLAALGAHHVHQGGMPTTPGGWAETLLALTGGDPLPWHLIVEDVSKPAFLQPPAPEKTLAVYSRPERTPDAIDVLVTSKNWDVKSASISSARNEHWVFALLNVQTSGGYPGSGNYGVVRMQGGYGSKPLVAHVPSLSWGKRFQQDVALLLDHREAVQKRFGYAADGHALLWTLFWDGNQQLKLSSLDPHFIEVCRRFRLVFEQDEIRAYRSPTKKTRIDDEERRGVVGDLWTPIVVEKIKGADEPGRKALTVAEGGFHFSLVRDLLFADGIEPSLAQGNYPDEGPLYFLAQVLVRGKGKTEGYHERVLPIPSEIRARLNREEEREKLARMSKAWVEAADLARLKVLRPALCSMLQGGPDKIDYEDERPQRWTDELNDRIDMAFFPKLWELAALPEQEATETWKAWLEAQARDLLLRAEQEAPVPAVQRLRAVARSEILFGFLAKKFLRPAAATDDPNTALASAAGDGSTPTEEPAHV